MTDQFTHFTDTLKSLIIILLGKTVIQVTTKCLSKSSGHPHTYNNNIVANDHRTCCCLKFYQIQNYVYVEETFSL